MFVSVDAIMDDTKFFAKTQQPPVGSAKYQKRCFQFFVAITCWRKEQTK
jgi:hypothetical protein